MVNTKKYIFIAEDDKAFGNVYRIKLEKEGYEVKIVERGDLVLDELKKRTPDLVVLDMIMPGKHGFEIIEEIRQDPKLENLKIIVASNLSQDTDRERVKKLGVLEYCVKSDISIAELVNKIKKAVEGG